MDIEVSAARQKICRKYKLNPDELCFAELIAQEWTPDDAWAVAMRIGVTWTKTARKNEIDKLLNKPGVLDFLRDKEGVPMPNVDTLAPDESESLYKRAINKESKIIELQKKLEDTNDPKMWLAINQQIIDVTRMKQEEVKKDDNTIHYYIPVNYPTSCKNCLVKLNKEKKEKKE